MRGALNFHNCHFAIPAIEMKGEFLAVVQKEERGVCFYVAEAGRDVLSVSFLVDRTDAEFVADAVFGAHEFGASLMC